ncbi:hypothetical protein ACIREO_11390 [Streptomyces sp. NPDC102441]|uniref:hypothetical protein n=1 Tax=Streptomyces sp. NPDC102441 TaxID=3366176 RepID=UPI003815CD84
MHPNPLGFAPAYGKPDPGLVLAAVDVLGEGQARRLYTHSLVHQALNRRAQ